MASLHAPARPRVDAHQPGGHATAAGPRRRGTGRAGRRARGRAAASGCLVPPRHWPWPNWAAMPSRWPAPTMCWRADPENGSAWTAPRPCAGAAAPLRRGAVGLRPAGGVAATACRGLVPPRPAAAAPGPPDRGAGQPGQGAVAGAGPCRCLDPARLAAQGPGPPDRSRGGLRARHRARRRCRAEPLLPGIAGPAGQPGHCTARLCAGPVRRLCRRLRRTPGRTCSATRRTASWSCRWPACRPALRVGAGPGLRHRAVRAAAAADRAASGRRGPVAGRCSTRRPRAGVYDRLLQADLVEHLHARRSATTWWWPPTCSSTSANWTRCSPACMRVLRPGGVFCFSVEHGRGRAGRWR